MVFITFYGIICDTFCKFSWEVFPDVCRLGLPDSLGSGEGDFWGRRILTSTFMS